MKQPKFKYDSSIKVGDIVTGYYKGYWKITEIVHRKYERKRHYQPNPLFVGVLLLDSNGNKVAPKHNNWDASYSKKITREFVFGIIDYGLDYFIIKKNNLLELIPEQI
jgi:hypothetical protein